MFCLTVYFRLGGYKSPVISEAQSEQLYLISKPHIGAYHKINPVITEVETWATKNNIPCLRTFGEYIDNPREKDEDRLRSQGGCILSHPLDPAQVPDGFTYRVAAPTPVLLATFDGAPSIGPFKVYPAVEEYMNNHKLQASGPVIEIYEIKSANEAVTRYYFPIKPLGTTPTQ